MHLSPELATQPPHPPPSHYKYVIPCVYTLNSHAASLNPCPASPRVIMNHHHMLHLHVHFTLPLTLPLTRTTRRVARRSFDMKTPHSPPTTAQRTPSPVTAGMTVSRSMNAHRHIASQPQFAFNSLIPSTLAVLTIHAHMCNQSESMIEQPPKVPTNPSQTVVWRSVTKPALCLLWGGIGRVPPLVLAMARQYVECGRGSEWRGGVANDVVGIVGTSTTTNTPVQTTTSTVVHSESQSTLSPTLRNSPAPVPVPVPAPYPSPSPLRSAQRRSRLPDNIHRVWNVLLAGNGGGDEDDGDDDYVPEEPDIHEINDGGAHGGGRKRRRKKQIVERASSLPAIESKKRNNKKKRQKQGKTGEKEAEAAVLGSGTAIIEGNHNSNYRHTLMHDNGGDATNPRARPYSPPRAQHQLQHRNETERLKPSPVAPTIPSHDPIACNQPKDARLGSPTAAASSCRHSPCKTTVRNVPSTTPPTSNDVQHIEQQNNISSNNKTNVVAVPMMRTAAAATVSPPTAPCGAVEGDTVAALISGCARILSEEQSILRQQRGVLHQIATLLLRSSENTTLFCPSDNGTGTLKSVLQSVLDILDRGDDMMSAYTGTYVNDKGVGWGVPGHLGTAPFPTMPMLPVMPETSAPVPMFPPLLVNATTAAINTIGLANGVDAPVSGTVLNGYRYQYQQQQQYPYHHPNSYNISNGLAVPPSPLSPPQELGHHADVPHFIPHLPPFVPQTTTATGTAAATAATYNVPPALAPAPPPATAPPPLMSASFFFQLIAHIEHAHAYELLACQIIKFVESYNVPESELPRDLMDDDGRRSRLSVPKVASSLKEWSESCRLSMNQRESGQ